MKTSTGSKIIITVSSGRGPAECERAVVLFTNWLRHSLSTGPGLASDCRIIEEKPGLWPDTRASICLEVNASSDLTAKALRVWLEGLTGTVQWICPSPYRPGHRRKNWFIQVNLGSAVPEANQGIDINPVDVRFETARSSGKGGQHVNKTETAVRAVHLPTGLVAISRDERSQLSNKKTALLRLGQRLAEQAVQSRLRQKARLRNQHDQLERGNAVASFTGPDFNPLPKHQAQDNHEY